MPPPCHPNIASSSATVGLQNESVPGLRGPEVKESASGGPQLPQHSKSESVRPCRLLGGPVCASLPNSSGSIPARCSGSAALSTAQASPWPLVRDEAPQIGCPLSGVKRTWIDDRPDRLRRD